MKMVLFACLFAEPRFVWVSYMQGKRPTSMLWLWPHENCFKYLKQKVEYLNQNKFRKTIVLTSGN